MQLNSAPVSPTSLTALQEATPAILDIRLLGGLVVLVDGTPLPKLRSRQGYRLLALLALRQGKSVERTFLATTLWPDADTANALSLLRRSLTDLRTALGKAGDRLESPTRHTLRLNMQAPARLDVTEFERAAGASSSLDDWDRAIALYRGALLEDYDDEWISLDRARLEGMYDGVRHARERLASPSRDQAASGRGGKRSQESNTPANTAAVSLGDNTPSSESNMSRRGNLPTYKNRFIGREKECRLLNRMLCDPDKRLVTITGTGGTGKTRLAIRVSDLLRGTFTGGVFFVPLSDILSPLLLPQSLAGAIGLTAVGSGSLVERIASFLSNSPEDGTPRLLVIDNCEHLIPRPKDPGDSGSVSALVDELLRRTAANLTILATSRQALAIPGEQTFLLKPLPSAKDQSKSGTAADKPFSASGSSEAAEAEYADSVLLFVERARESHPGFLGSARNASIIAEICDVLDGLPLAIEIAASWTPLLSPQQIGERLKRMDGHRQRDVLVNRRHVDNPSNRRHSLDAMLEWSFQLLSPTHQTFFALLSVFRGGWDIDAAEAVYAAVAQSETANISNLHMLSHLTESSLVVVEEDPVATRYRFLETIRVFARGKLDAQPQVATYATKSHAEYFARQMAEAAPGLRNGDQQAAWMNRLNKDVNNLRAALDWYQNQSKENEALLKLCNDTYIYWEADGALSEGYGRMVAVLDKTAGDPPSVLRATLLNNAGSFARQRGDFGAAHGHHEEAVKICRALGERGLLASSLTNLATAIYYEGDHETSYELYEEGLEIAREAGDLPRIALALGNLGVFAQRRGEYSRAIALFEEQLAIRRTAGSPAQIAVTLSNLATSLDSNGQTKEAEATLVEAESILRAIGHRTHLPYVLHMRAIMARTAGDYNAADARLREAIPLEHEADLKYDLVESLSEFALLKSMTNEHSLAACLTGAVAAAQERFGLVPGDSDRSTKTLERCAEALGAEAVQSHLYQGRLLTLDAAVAAALG